MVRTTSDPKASSISCLLNLLSDTPNLAELTFEGTFHDYHQLLENLVAQQGFLPSLRLLKLFYSDDRSIGLGFPHTPYILPGLYLERVDFPWVKMKEAVAGVGRRGRPLTVALTSSLVEESSVRDSLEKYGIWVLESDEKSKGESPTPVVLALNYEAIPSRMWYHDGGDTSSA
ncbi:hypothetical protein FA15DRAFT_709058 [Coprinopsis marcescibilis]|uniref:Uncharacterized protein n=1 Tax=Coprinopsis marcescibilis TaxID=230819 RepID=A0A5C3KGM7_COPMA|nr:hypothetical protein FA15DRAFT_709058 [Coprinopsis marcescibilis]